MVIFVPVLYCKNPDPTHECEPIVLPYSGLKTTALTLGELWDEYPETPEGETHLLDWPPDEWKAFFGCSECGFVSEYTSVDVDHLSIPKSVPGIFHSGADCFCIEFRCGQRNCALPTKLHVQMSGLTESGVQALLRRPFFIGSLPCGHDVPSLPISQYQIHKVMDPIG